MAPGPGGRPKLPPRGTNRGGIVRRTAPLPRPPDAPSPSCLICKDATMARIGLPALVCAAVLLNIPADNHAQAPPAREPEVSIESCLIAQMAVGQAELYLRD